MGPAALDAITGLDLESGGSFPGREVAGSLVELSRAAEELEAVDIVLRDIDRGLVDFPALADDREIYLCWELGEDEVAYWHGLEGGYGGREPLD